MNSRTDMETDIRVREAVRYLGYGRKEVDEQTLELIREAFAALEETAAKRIVWQRRPVTFPEDDRVETEGMKIHSHGLAKNLKGCGEMILVAATLGTQIDLLLRKYNRTDMTRAVVMQACAAAELEEYLDQWQDEMKEKLGEEGLYPRPRFSPGYGDFSIQHQKELLSLLDAPKRIGLTMTEGCMLTPTKSVTAVMGLSREKFPCHRQGCEACGKTDCAYRR